MVDMVQWLRNERSGQVVQGGKTMVQVALLIVGIAMVCFGVMRGEADAVLAKAIRLCLECIGIG